VAELARLDDALSRNATVPALVALHHHPVPIGSAWMDAMGLRNAEDFWRIIDRHAQVRAVIWGHVHQNFDSFRHGVRLLATPSTCVQFAPRSADFALDRRAPAFRSLLLSDDGGVATEVCRVRDFTERL
jgi:Icc protein